jgi:hypothetical protein
VRWVSSSLSPHRPFGPPAGADIFVLGRDLPTAHSSAIIGTSVRLTVLGGRIVHRSEELA